MEEDAEEGLEDEGQLEDWDEDAEGQEWDTLPDALDPEEALSPGARADGASNGLLSGRLGLPQVIMVAASSASL